MCDTIDSNQRGNVSELKNNILRMRSEGASYRKIQAVLGCSKATIAYYLSDGEKAKVAERTRALRSQNSLIRKTESFQAQRKGQNNKAAHFHRDYEGGGYGPMNFSYDDVVEYLDGNYTCYLTGDTIELNDPKSYSFDHIVPVSRGGTNELHNLGLTTREANAAKSDMTVEEFVDMCVKVAKHFGRV